MDYSELRNVVVRHDHFTFVGNVVIGRDGNGLRVAEEQQKTIRFKDIAWVDATDWYDGLFLMALTLSPPHVRLRLKDGSAWNIFMDYLAFQKTKETADAFETLRQMYSP